MPKTPTSPIHDAAVDTFSRWLTADLHFDADDPPGYPLQELAVARDNGCDYNTVVICEPDTGTPHNFTLASGQNQRTWTQAELNAEGFTVFDDVGSHTITAV